MTSRPSWEASEVRQDELLKPYTTFRIGGPARYFANIRSPSDLMPALDFARTRRLPTFVLGGGSNILVSDRGLDGLVLHPTQEGITIVEEGADSVTLRCNAAEVWDGVVAHTVENGWWGIENLSHIPGQAGAALVQNIGAYGQQLSDVFVSAEVMDFQSKEVRPCTAGDCQPAYRKSIFNTTAKGRFFILSLTLTLAKSYQPNLRYADVQKYFESRRIARPTQREIREAIIAIRDRKFPFPREEKGGNAGSFFKNLILSGTEFERLENAVGRNFSPETLTRLQELARGVAEADRIKVPTAWLIDICGLKGFQVGKARVNESQPLVILNDGGATATDVMRLVRHIRQTIYQRTGMTISIEPELVGFTKGELDDYLALE
ncbi:MAG TPA: UDP-N-acetylmuramate dehydrogenase [Terriglobia bacterium]|nr:UDP-N-acetylmuramate dehydrogenase [Terriglobia bacterium]